MSAQQAYMCDAPDCQELTTKKRKTRYPEHWDRVTHHRPDGSMMTGSVHSAECAVNWLRAQFDGNVRVEAGSAE